MMSPQPQNLSRSTPFGIRCIQIQLGSVRSNSGTKLLLRALRPLLLMSPATAPVACLSHADDGGARRLPYLLFADGSPMSRERCGQMALSRGYSVFGLEDGNECWAGGWSCSCWTWCSFWWF